MKRFNLKTLLDKKYLPFYVLGVGIFVFGAAFFYSSKKNNTKMVSVDPTPGMISEEQDVLPAENEITPTIEVNNTPTVKKVKMTATPIPTSTSRPTLTPTNTPTPTTKPSETPSIIPTPSSTPTTTPTVTVTPTDGPPPTP